MKIVNRIKKTDEFALTIKKGKAVNSRSYTVHYVTNNLPYTRVGLSISTKVGNAVVRSRCKRQVRAMCDSLLDYNKQSLDLVIVIRKPFLGYSFNENKSQLCDLLGVQKGN